MTAATAIGHQVVAPALRWLLRAEVTGLHHVPPSGGLLLAANHRSFLDHVLLAAVAPRPLVFLGKAELTKGFAGRVNLAYGMIPVQRGTGDLAALEAVADLLRAGAAVAIFPEGTRSPSGELFRFRSGLPRLAAMAQVPVVPIGLIGTAQVWPRGRRPVLRRPSRGQLRVIFDEALPAPAADPRSRRVFTERLHAAVAELCGQPRADRFAQIEP